MKRDTAALFAGPVRAATFLIAEGPGSTEAMLGIGPARGVTPGFFDELSPQELEVYRSRFCRLITDANRARSLPAPTCGTITRDSVRQRSALVVEYDLQGPSGDAHVFAIQVPTTEGIVTLTLVSGPSALQDNLPLFRRIWRSLVVPDTVSWMPR
jgi:hypothetical protein